MPSSWRQVRVVGINLPGLITTILAIGPRYALLTLLAVLIQELGRIILTVSFGSEIKEIWFGGFFSSACGNDGMTPWLGLLGPAWSLILAICLNGSYRPSLLSLVNPASTHKRAMGMVMLKLALGSALVALWRMLPR